MTACPCVPLIWPGNGRCELRAWNCRCETVLLGARLHQQLLFKFPTSQIFNPWQAAGKGGWNPLEGMKVEIDAASASAKHVRSLAWNREADFPWRVWPREVLFVDFGSSSLLVFTDWHPLDLMSLKKASEPFDL